MSFHPGPSLVTNGTLIPGLITNTRFGGRAEQTRGAHGLDQHKPGSGPALFVPGLDMS